MSPKFVCSGNKFNDDEHQYRFEKLPDLYIQMSVQSAETSDLVFLREINPIYKLSCDLNLQDISSGNQEPFMRV
jgi:hypothetical protein